MTEELESVEYVNHPKHYNLHESGLECIELVRLLDFNVGSAVKYVWRMNNKFDAVEDSKKCVWYLKDELANEDVFGFIAPASALALATKFSDAEENKTVANLVLAAVRSACSDDVDSKKSYLLEAIAFGEELIASL